jgi:hypothetical protein
MSHWNWLSGKLHAERNAIVEAIIDSLVIFLVFYLELVLARLSIAARQHVSNKLVVFTKLGESLLSCQSNGQ